MTKLLPPDEAEGDQFRRTESGGVPAEAGDHQHYDHNHHHHYHGSKARSIQPKKLRMQQQRLKSNQPLNMIPTSAAENDKYSVPLYKKRTSSSSSSSPDLSPESLSEGDQEEEKGVVIKDLHLDEEEEEEVTCLSHGVASVMGRRREMEDTATAEIGYLKGIRRMDLFAVFDGHGGSSVAEACRDRMHRILKREIELEIHKKRERVRDTDSIITVVDWEKMMLRSFQRMDKEAGITVLEGGGEGGIRKEQELTVGSTAVVALVGAHELVVAHCGDSRAVICRNGLAVPLSIDHKPDRPDELARIEAAGGKVINWNGCRVLGVLATSRSIGDNYLKPYVISEPEVTVLKRTEEDEFLILASDGLWDVVSNEVACQMARRCFGSRRLRRSHSKKQDDAGIRQKVAEARRRINGAAKTNDNGAAKTNDNGASDAAAALLVELALARGSRDNISVLVVELNRRTIKHHLRAG